MVAPHLSEMDSERTAQCAACYRENAMRSVQIEAFLPAAIADQTSELLSSRVKFSSAYGLHKTQGHIVERDEWLQSEESNRFFHYEMMTGITGNVLGSDALTFLKLRQFLSSDAFCEFGRRITGEAVTSLTKPRVHRLNREHYLRPHNDRSGLRKIAYVLYLSRDWKAQFGGQLTLVGNDGRRLQYEPTFNSLVLFDVTANKEHHVGQLTDQAKGRSRNTMSGWFLSEAKS